MMMQENLPPPPSFDKPEPPKLTHRLYACYGKEWVEIGSGKPSDDGKGLQLTFEIGIPDGSVVEARALDPANYPAPIPERKRTPRPKHGR
jgi:hypothetical protein